MELNPAKLPTKNLNIRVNTTPADGIAVRVDISDKKKGHFEAKAPYAVFSDTDGDYDPWTPKVGTYVITATPFGNSKGKGPPGKALQIAIRVIGP